MAKVVCPIIGKEIDERECLEMQAVACIREKIVCPAGRAVAAAHKAKGGNGQAASGYFTCMYCGRKVAKAGVVHRSCAEAHKRSERVMASVMTTQSREYMVKTYQRAMEVMGHAVRRP